MHSADELLILLDPRIGFDVFEERATKRLYQRTSYQGLFYVLMIVLCVGVWLLAPQQSGTAPMTMETRLWLIMTVIPCALTPVTAIYCGVPYWTTFRLKGRRFARSRIRGSQPRLAVQVQHALALAILNPGIFSMALVGMAAVPLYLVVTGSVPPTQLRELPVMALALWVLLWGAASVHIWYTVYWLMPNRYRQSRCVACGHPISLKGNSQDPPHARCTECGTPRRIERAVDWL